VETPGGRQDNGNAIV